MIAVALIGIGLMAFGLLCVLLAIQADVAAIRRIAVGESMREDAETIEAYTRGVNDGRRLEAEERDQ